MEREETAEYILLQHSGVDWVKCLLVPRSLPEVFSKLKRMLIFLEEFG